MSKAIYEKDLNLLKISETPKTHPELMDIIENNPEIHLEELITVSPEHSRFFYNVYDKVKRTSFDEWKGCLESGIIKVPKSAKVKCYICNRYIENVCNIQNRLNGKIIPIGTECNKHFKIYDDDEVNKILKKQGYLLRINRLDQLYPKLQHKINKWTEFIDLEEMYLFDYVVDEYINIGDQLAKLFKEYTKETKSLKAKRENEILKEIKVLLSKGSIEKEKINLFISENKGKLLYPSKKMVKSLNRTGIEYLNKDRLIKLRTLYRFNNEEFIKRLIPEFNKHSTKYDLIIDSFMRFNNFIGYNIILNKNSEVKLFVDYEYMCYLCGGDITDEPNFINPSLNEFVMKNKLIDEYSIEYGLQLLENILYKRNIVVAHYFHEYDDVILKVKKSSDSDKPKYFYRTQIKDIEQILKELLYKIKGYSVEELFCIIDLNSENMSNTDAEELMNKRFSF